MFMPFQFVPVPIVKRRGRKLSSSRAVTTTQPVKQTAVIWQLSAVANGRRNFVIPSMTYGPRIPTKNASLTRTLYEAVLVTGAIKDYASTQYTHLSERRCSDCNVARTTTRQSDMTARSWPRVESWRSSQPTNNTRVTDRRQYKISRITTAKCPVAGP